MILEALVRTDAQARRGQSLGTRSRTTHRTAFKFAGIVALIITLTNVAIFTVLYIVISRHLTDNLYAHVEEVAKTLADVEGEEDDGFQELAAMVAHHAVIAQSDEDIYLLTDKDRRYVAGNVSSMERFDGWRKVRWEDLKLVGNWSSTRTSDAIIGRWVTIKNGHLFVGDGNGDIKDAQKWLLVGLVWGIVLSIVSALIGGYMLGRRAQRRILQMAQTLNAVASGSLEQRVPRNAARDDLDQVASLINATLERLQGLFVNLKQVSVDIAHDLRTPISRMRQQLESVRKGPQALGSYVEVVDDAIAEIDVISETFDGLMRISEIEAGARKSKFTDVELNPLIAHVADAFLAPAEDRRQRLHASLPSQSVQVRGDRRLLMQLFANILQNAVIHSPPESRVDIELSAEQEAAIVRVSDNGPGIPTEEKEKVFRRLYRLDKSRSTPGNGLGLPLAAAIAELHGATIKLDDNNPGLVVEVRFDPAELQRRLVS